MQLSVCLSVNVSRLVGSSVLPELLLLVFETILLFCKPNSINLSIFPGIYGSVISWGFGGSILSTLLNKFGTNTNN